jgi:tRNA(fMet)-specific endonuclease VapC
VLDTDHMSLLQRADSTEGRQLAIRLEPFPESEISTTIVAFEEQARGWMAQISKAKRLGEVVVAYSRLLQLLNDYRKLQVLSFDTTAAQEFERLRASKVRIGTMDLRIAAIARSRGATLLTRNQADFSKVPGLQIADWTA